MNQLTQVNDKKPAVTRKNQRFYPQKIKSGRNTNSPVGRVLFLQRTAGNQAVQKLIKSGYLQTKLKVGRPGDKYEQEADRVADSVMRMKEPQPLSMNGLTIQRACQSCEEEELQMQPIEEEEEVLQMQPTEEEEEELQMQPTEEEEELQMQPIEEEEEELQMQSIEEEEEELQMQPIEGEEEELQMQSRGEGLNNMSMIRYSQSIPPPEEEELAQAKFVGKSASKFSSNVQSQINNLRGGGQQLPASARTYFEPRFGYNFSSVRIHNNGQASNTARAINARAFTMGNNVVFGSGEYSPETAKGKQLLAHELTHVIQQSRSSTVKQQKYGSSSPLDIQRLQNGHAFLQRWSIGAPVPGINTIVCNGSGGIKVQAGATGNAQQTKCLKHCIIQHEKSHRGDALAENSKICKSQTSGKTVRPNNGTQRKKTEIKASNVEIKCLNKKLPKASGTCKPIITARITQIKAYRDSFK